MLTEKQYTVLRNMLQPFMEEDSYGQHTICNLYYDTETFNLIRTSLDKPVYKEKLRLRSYGVPGLQDWVYLEIKKKYRGIVYKRRIRMVLSEVYQYLNSGVRPKAESQILHEVDWFLQNNQVRARVFIAYDRIALFGREDSSLRITFDQNIRYRENALDLSQGHRGKRVIEQNRYLMEIKIPGVMPLWLSGMLSALGIRPMSFSKYGTYFQNRLQQKNEIIEGDNNCA